MIQGSVRSTTHRRRMTTQPFIQGMRLTISRVTLVLSLAHAPGVGAIREHGLHEGKRPAGPLQHALGAVAILDVGGVDLDCEQSAVGVSQGVAVSATGSSEPPNALAALDALFGIISFESPFWSAVRTVWLSMTAALGEASRQARSRSSRSSAC
jgi:hypothetical protein